MFNICYVVTDWLWFEDLNGIGFSHFADAWYMLQAGLDAFALAWCGVIIDSVESKAQRRAIVVYAEVIFFMYMCPDLLRALSVKSSLDIYLSEAYAFVMNHAYVLDLVMASVGGLKSNRE